MDSESVKADRFLDGRQEVESPFHWAENVYEQTRTESTEEQEAWSMRGGEIQLENSSWAECGAQMKDSGFYDVNKSIRASLDNDDVQTHAQMEDLYMPSQPTPHEHLLSPIPIGPKGDLDWLRFSFLVWNNQLSFDNIAELVTKTTPDTIKFKQQKPLTVILPEVRDCMSHHQSSGRPGKPSQIFEYDVSPLEEEPPRPFSNVIGRLEREGREVGFEKKLSGDTVREDEDEKEINWTTHWSQALPELDHVQDDISSVTRDRSQSCFSSDSSLCTTAEDEECPTKEEAKAWWKPKRKLERIHEDPEAMSENNHRASRENAGRLWKRGSRSPSSKIIVEKELMEKVERKLQEKRHAAAEIANVQASERSVRANRSSDTTHPAYRGRRETMKMNSEINASTHILTQNFTLHHQSPAL
jgi:hypothetical protein